MGGRSSGEAGAARGRGALGRRWLPALEEARAGSRVVNVLWVGDSISELNATGAPVPWHVGRILSGWTELTQYLNATGDEYSPSMATTGTPTPMEEAGLGGRAVDLAPGQSCSAGVAGEGVTVLWTRRPDGGLLEVSWGDEVLGSIDTAGEVRRSLATTFRRRPALLPEHLSITCTAGSARLEGVYVHGSNLDSGVRVWPAVRSGNANRHFVEHAGWALDALASLQPDLVVIATGTNDVDYPGELVEVIDAVRQGAPEADLAVWLPPINGQFTVERAAAGRRLAATGDWTLIDSAAVLGALPTIDGVHPSALTVALSAGHAAAVLAGDDAGGAASLVADVVSSLSGGQIWEPGVGTVSLDAVLGSTLLSARLEPDDVGQSWALLPPDLAQPLLDLPGVSLSFGPGGPDPIDAHLSRVGPGELAVNAGTGQLDAGRLLLGEGGEPPIPVSGAVLYSRPGSAGTELVARVSDGSTRLLAGEPHRPAAGLVAPVPCAVAPHRRIGADVAIEVGTVVWVPFPVLAAPALATHVWIDLSLPAAGARGTAAIVGTAADGRPGDRLATTPVGAIDLTAAGVVGAALAEPVVVGAGDRWWVAVHVAGTDHAPVARGGEDLEGWPTVQVGEAPVVPTAGRTGAGLRAVGLAGIPDRPGPGVTDLAGPVPVVHVSLQTP